MFRLIILCLPLAVVYSNDLQEGKDGGRIVFNEKFHANPALWTQVQNVTVNATDSEVISRIKVTDLRQNKDGEAKIVEGGPGEKNVTIELKGPAIFRGFEFQVEVYAVPDRKSRSTTVVTTDNTGTVIYNGTDVVMFNDTHVNYDDERINDGLTTIDSNVSVSAPAETGESIEKRDAQEHAVEEEEPAESIDEETAFSNLGNAESDKVGTGVNDNITVPAAEEVKEKRQADTQDQAVEDSSSSDGNVASDKVNVGVVTNVNDHIGEEEGQEKRDTQDQAVEDSSSHSDNVASDKVNVGVATNVNDHIIGAKKRDTQDQAVEDSGTNEGNLASDHVNVGVATNVNDYIVGEIKRDTQDQAVENSGSSKGNVASDKVNVLVGTNVNDYIEVKKRETQEQAVEDGSSSNGNLASDRVNVVVATNVNDNITGAGKLNTQEQTADDSSSDDEESSGDTQDQAATDGSSRNGDIASDRVNVLVATNVNDNIQKRDAESVAQEEIVPNNAQSNNATVSNTNTTAGAKEEVSSTALNGVGNTHATEATEESKEKRQTEDVDQDQVVLNDEETTDTVSTTNITAKANDSEDNTSIVTATNEETKEKRQAEGFPIQDPIVQYIQPIAPEVIVENQEQNDGEMFETGALENGEIINTGRIARYAPYEYFERQETTTEVTTTEVTTTEVPTTEVTTETQTTKKYDHGNWQEANQRVYEDITKQLSQSVADNMKTYFL